MLLPKAGIAAQAQEVVMDDRPLVLVKGLAESRLKRVLQRCTQGPFRRSDFSIAHRGAPLGYPEHTQESYIAAARQGAGRLECDVVMTRDGALVCRHAQCDLHTTTNILTVPALAARCREPFRPARFNPDSGALVTPATAHCCTSDIDLTEFLSLRGKQDGHNQTASNPDEYLLHWTPGADPHMQGGTLITHRDSIKLFNAMRVGMMPELKHSENHPPKGVDSDDYARALLQDYQDLGIKGADVWLQSFELQDILYWIQNGGVYGKQAVYLDGRYRDEGFDHQQPDTWEPSMAELVQMGVRIIAPPLWVLLDLEDGEIVPSSYARSAQAAGLEIVTWTLERSGSLQQGGGWYYQTIAPNISSDSDIFRVLDVLATQVKVSGVFSDWPATVTFYANCMGLD
ncbi:MAG: glycerophosphodiester phosphodiesterase [Halioglobus sp.]|nr:glycerophosphodiester phosphodiesterase [Halioglobus sp.]